jgi:MoxR-like ATPase
MSTANNMHPAIKAVVDRLPQNQTVKRSEIFKVADELGYRWPQIKDLMTDSRRAERGYYFIGDLNGTGVMPPTPAPTAHAVTPTKVEVSMPKKRMAAALTASIEVPQKDPSFVRWGHQSLIEQVIRAKRFFPVFITGHSGNGKTVMVEQACARLNREMTRVQISPETDTDDLLGGFRLIDGDTVFVKGPVVNAMERGAVLLLDEVDRSSSKLMCLQSILEGKAILIAKTGEVIHPHPQFTVIATANTKGRGSDDGKYVFATIMDDAFLERFNITIEQGKPAINVEERIIIANMEKYGWVDKEFAKLLAQWSDAIYKTYEGGGVEDIVSTRRLSLIANTFAVTKARKKSVQLCLARFDKVVSEAFMSLYDKIDGSTDAPPPDENQSLADILDS